MSGQPLAVSSQNQVEIELAEYKRTRHTEPHFYYNELAARGQALATLRPILENFLTDLSDLATFVRECGHFSRVEQARLRGLEVGQHWRLNATGRLLLETLYKQAQSSGRLNLAQNTLQEALRLPVSLDAAGQKIESLVHLLEDLTELSGTKTLPAKSGLVPYLLSYFWAIQSASWPLFTPQIKSLLTKLELLTDTHASKLPADAYNRFFLVCNTLAQRLELSLGELESFLNWLANRQLNNAQFNLSSRTRTAISNPRSQSRRNTRLRQQLEKLNAMLEPLLKVQLAAGFRHQIKAGTLTFDEPFKKFRLGLWPLQNTGGFWEGINFDGFGPNIDIGEAGQTLLRWLQNFLAANDYKFYAAAPNFANTSKTPELSDLQNEFALLRELPARTKGTALIQTLAIDWPPLYRLAQELAQQIENPEPQEPDIIYSYPDPAVPQKVAESALLYEVESQKPPLLLEYKPEAALAPLLETDVIEKPPENIKPSELTQAQALALTEFVQERLIITAEKIAEILTHLEAGREVLLYGPPGCGKTRLARLLAGQLCALQPGATPENAATNYTLATATAEWSVYDTIGGIRPDVSSEKSNAGLSYRFEPGIVARAAMACEASLKQTGRPHFLIIDEFNRANQERAFGELFTIIEYRDRPILPAKLAGRTQPLFLPPAFRIIGTMNADDRNSLFETGFALRRRFALVEIEVPPPAAERRFLPRSVQVRLPQLKLLDGEAFADHQLERALDILIEFVTAVRPNPNEAANTGKTLGTALLIEVLVFCAVASRFYINPQDALEDALIANLLPQLERAPNAINRALAALNANPKLAQLKRVQVALERMKGNGFY